MYLLHLDYLTFLVQKFLPYSNINYTRMNSVTQKYNFLKLVQHRLEIIKETSIAENANYVTFYDSFHSFYILNL